MGVISGTGTAYSSVTHEFIHVFSGVRVARSFVFCVVFCRSLFILFLLDIVLSILLRFKDSDYPFSTFKLFLYNYSLKKSIHSNNVEISNTVSFIGGGNRRTR